MTVTTPATELTRRIDILTHRQIYDLQVHHDADRVVLLGRSRTYYVKQLAAHAVLELLPGVQVDNSIAVVR